jgi:hypothetical protein
MPDQINKSRNDKLSETRNFLNSITDIFSLVDGSDNTKKLSSIMSELLSYSKLEINKTSRDRINKINRKILIILTKAVKQQTVMEYDKKITELEAALESVNFDNIQDMIKKVFTLIYESPLFIPEISVKINKLRRKLNKKIGELGKVKS